MRITCFRARISRGNDCFRYFVGSKWCLDREGVAAIHFVATRFAAVRRRCGFVDVSARTLDLPQSVHGIPADPNNRTRVYAHKPGGNESSSGNGIETDRLPTAGIPAFRARNQSSRFRRIEFISRAARLHVHRTLSPRSTCRCVGY